VIRLHLTATDFGRLRFAVSPVWEAVTSLRLLMRGGRQGVHGRWAHDVAGSLGELDLALLSAVIRPHGYLPDFLQPLPAERAPNFDVGIEQIAVTDPDIVAAELTHLARHRIAQQGKGRGQRVRMLTKLADSPGQARKRIAVELQRYWRVALAPWWPRIHAVLQADLDYRLDQLATGGVAQLFGTLHPSVTLYEDTVFVVKYYEGDASLGGRGLLLIPCAFAWPDVIVRTADPQPALSYTPRGLGRLWETTPAATDSALAGVLGRTRAAILAHLDVPMTTSQLATHLALTAPSVSAHLKALHIAGLLDARRAGRSVLYSRSSVAEDLLANQQRRG
jgi:DNA-binding transcriptional ArsR family regulator